MAPDKVIIEKSRGEVFLMEQDTIENVSWPIKNLKFFFNFIYFRSSFEVYDGFIGQKILKL